MIIINAFSYHAFVVPNLSDGSSDFIIVVRREKEGENAFAEKWPIHQREEIRKYW